jgi:hypothetical protein
MMQVKAVLMSDVRDRLRAGCNLLLVSNNLSRIKKPANDHSLAGFRIW